MTRYFYVFRELFKENNSAINKGYDIVRVSDGNHFNLQEYTKTSLSENPEFDKYFILFFSELTESDCNSFMGGYNS